MSNLPDLEAYSDFSWVGHPSGGSGTPEDRLLIERRNEIDLIGGIVDEDASYSFDETALVKLDDTYYLVQTSGCSCPSPNEEWRVAKASKDVADIKQFIVDGDYGGYTYRSGEMAILMGIIEGEIGSSAAKYELWDTGTGSIIGGFASLNSLVQSALELGQSNYMQEINVTAVEVSKLN